jgi:hypothetical protein
MTFMIFEFGAQILHAEDAEFGSWHPNYADFLQKCDFSMKVVKKSDFLLDDTALNLYILHRK